MAQVNPMGASEHIQLSTVGSSNSQACEQFHGPMVAATPEISFLEPSSRRQALTLLLIGLTAVWPLRAIAQAQIDAKADVNSQVVVTVNNAAVPNATGSAVAAAKIFHPAAGMAGSSYQVNGAVAKATESPILDTIAVLAEPIAVNAGNAIKQAPFIKGTKGRIATCTIPDTTGGPGKPCKVVANTGSFPLIAKGGAGISSDTGNVQRMVGGNNYEFASATASQMTPAGGKFKAISNPVTQVNAANKLPAPVAVAYATNRDPMAVDWSSSSNHSITLDLSLMQVTLTTHGAGAAASGFVAFDAAVIDGTNDITLPESSATSFFNMLLPFSEVGGGAPTLNLAAFQLAATGNISDNFGNVGNTNVAAGLISDLTVSGGTIQFALPYLITMEVPSSSMQSVLFVDSQSFAESAATPENPTLLLLGTAILGLATWLRRSST